VTRARELLAALVDPKIGDPLCAGQDGAGRMPRQIVPLAVGVQVVPEGGRALARPQRDAQLGEDGGAAQLHVRGVHEEGGDAIAGPEAGERVLLLPPRKVKVGLVVAADSVVGHLQTRVRGCELI
jgi:hypothetical protein